MKKIFAFLFLSLAIFSANAATEIRDTEIENYIGIATKPLFKAENINPKIHIVSDNSFNAYTSGSSDIFINTGLLTKIDDWSELQAVLAHEIGHASLGHMAQMDARMKAETTRAMAMQMLGIGLIAVNPELAIGAMAGASGIAMQSMLAFGRDEERAADDYAIKLLKKIGTSPSALLSVFQKMQNLSTEDTINPNNINHPLTEERIRNIKLRLTKAEKENKPNRDGLKIVQAKLIGYLDSEDRINSLYSESDKSDAAIYARTIYKTRTGDLPIAKIGADNLISKNKNNPYFYELLGDIEFQLGHYDDSVRAYEKSLSLLSTNKTQIEIALALVLSERKDTGDISKATELCKSALLNEKYPLAYWVLAKSDAKKSDYYLAEYYYSYNDIKQAKLHANLAIKELPKNSPEYLKSSDIINLK